MKKKLILLIIIFIANVPLIATSSGQNITAGAPANEQSSAGSSGKSLTCDKSISEAQKTLRNKTKDTLKEMTSEGIKPVEEKVSEFSCVEDIWEDMAALFPTSGGGLDAAGLIDAGEQQVQGMIDDGIEGLQGAMCEIVQDLVDTGAEALALGESSEGDATNETEGTAGGGAADTGSIASALGANLQSLGSSSNGNNTNSAIQQELDTQFGTSLYN